jgi:hypothetical protein
MLAVNPHWRALEVVSRIGASEVSNALKLSCGIGLSGSLAEERKVFNGSCLLCIYQQDVENYLYVHVPFVGGPDKGFTCIIPEGNVSHGLLLCALLRAIGREGVVEPAKSAGGMVRNLLGDFVVHGVSALFNVEANAKVTELLAARKPGSPATLPPVNVRGDCGLV